MGVYDVHNWGELQWVLQRYHVVVLDFYAQWCGPCKQVAPQLPQFAASFEGHVGVVKIDVDQAPDLMSHFAVQAMPTFVILQGQGGQVVAGRVQGANLGEVGQYARAALRSVSVEFHARKKHEAQVAAQQLRHHQAQQHAKAKHETHQHSSGSRHHQSSSSQPPHSKQQSSSSQHHSSQRRRVLHNTHDSRTHHSIADTSSQRRRHAQVAAAAQAQAAHHSSQRRQTATSAKEQAAPAAAPKKRWVCRGDACVLE